VKELSTIERGCTNFSTAFEQIQQKNPNFANIWNNKGHILEKLERYEEALIAYEWAIQLDAKNADYYRDKGRVLEKLERYEETLVAYEQAIKLEPSSGYI
jgi:tetratricopeptide (TPR) repeat protein